MITLLLLCLIQDRVDRLIERLGGDDIEERDAATRELIERARKDAAVRKRLATEAASSKSVEIRNRLSAALIGVEWTATGDVGIPARLSWASLSDGRRLVLWGGNDGNTRRTDGALYQNGVWKPLPSADIEPRVLPNLVLCGDHLVVWSGGDRRHYFDDGAVYDLAKATVRTVPAAPIVGRARPFVVDLGGRLLFWGGEVEKNDLLQAEQPVQIMWQRPTYPGDGAILDLKTLAWTKIAACPLTGRIGSPVWTGSELIVAGGFVEREMGRREELKDAAAYDPARDAWRKLEDVPLRLVNRLHTTSKGVLAWGVGGALLSGDSWTRLADAPVLAPFRGIAKDRVLLWSDEKTAGAVYDVKAERWTEAPKCPLDRRVTAHVSWDGDSVMVWGGRTFEDKPRFFTDGARWTLGANSWKVLSEPALSVDGRMGTATSWNGRYLVHWGGLTPGEGKGGWLSPLKIFEDAAIYDSVADVWRVVPKAGPLAPWIRSPRFAWVDGQLLIVAPDLSRALTWNSASE